MAINWTEAQIEEVVASVLKSLSGNTVTSKNAWDSTQYNGRKFVGVYADMNDAITAATAGYKAVCAMALEGYKVLMIDGDMQINLTISYFDEEQALEFAQSGKTIYTAIKEEKDLSDFITHTGIEGLDIVPSSSLMSSIEFDLFSKWQRELVLTKCLEKVCAMDITITY